MKARLYSLPQAHAPFPSRKRLDGLIRRLRLAALARQKVQVFKHKLDIRYSREDLVSHDRIRIPSVPVCSAADVVDRVRPGTQVVGIDEAHFFDGRIVGVCAGPSPTEAAA